jgi:tetratricopeptide (TPR) repeat protein
LAAVIAATAMGVWLLSSRPESERAAPDIPVASSATAQRPALAVLRFQNLTGDAELAWLRSGLTEMLVTELSQSPEIAVTSTALLYESLKQNELLEEPAPSFDQIRELARDVEATSVVRGSYALVGGLFRISMTIEDVESGEILGSNQVEGEGQESVFSLVDQIAAVVRNSYEISRPLESPPTVAAAATSSLDAWRLYTEGIALANEFKSSEAIVLLDRAVEIDPSFALALASLGGIHSQMGHEELANENLRRALALTDRLPVDARYRVEGTYYGERWSTLNRANEIYEEGLRIYPDKEAWRNNLARIYAFHERYNDALREFNKLIEDGSDFMGDYFDAANAHAGLGQMEKGYSLLSVWESSDEWFIQQALGWYLTEWGRLQEAEARFQNAEFLRPGEWTIRYARWRIAVLSENWDDADAHARQFSSPTEPQARWRAAVSLARNALYRGSAREAVTFFDSAATSYPSPNAYTALARCWKAELLLETGRPREALREAEIARESGVEEFPELKAMFVAALAHDALGQRSEADALVRELEISWQNHGGNKGEERQLHLLRGRLALARGEAESGVDAMRRAASLLSPKGVEFHWHVYPDHVPVWVTLGEAELAAGQSEQALDAFELAAESGSERLEQPVPFVRSLYFLGQLELVRGEPDKARHYFERFLSYWRNGELDRERIREAQAAVGG